MTIPLAIGPQDTSDLLARINTLTIQVNALLTGSIALALGPQDVSDLIGRLNNLTVQVNILVPATIPLLQGPQDASDLLARLNLLTNQVNALGGSPTPYHAGAVHFDGASSLFTLALTAPAANPYFSMSLWFKAGAQKKSLFLVDPEGNFTTNGNFGENNVNVGDTKVSVDPYPADGSFGFIVVANALCLDDAWHNIIFSIDTTNGAGLKVAKVYLDDVDVGEIHSDNHDGFDMLFNGKSFYFADSSFGDFITGDLADVWIAPNISILVAGDIPLATRRLFIDGSGKPVNPSGFPSSAILFSGNASGFGTNQGAGGAFTPTGALTNASSSPSD